VFSIALNGALFYASFKLLSSAEVGGRSLMWGVAFSAVAWEVLQVAGGIYIHHVVSKASNTYGTFALVIGVLAWLHLGAQLTLYGAELDSVLARRLYPRSLLGPPSTPADETTLRALAEVEERSDVQQIDVAFESGPNGTPDPGAESPADRRPEDPNEGHPAPWV
jgi:uncharacterized BrkB/YihY/UPF0761 family membrane protein